MCRACPWSPPSGCRIDSIDVTTVGEATIWWLLFSLVGLLLGVIYLTLLARRLPIGSVAGAPVGQVAVAVLRHWLQVIGFVIIVGLGLLIAILAGQLCRRPDDVGQSRHWFGGRSVGRRVTLVVFFYLYFVTAALIMDNVPLTVAIMRSIRLVQENFWATLGFIVLSNLIGLGFALLLVQLADLANVGGICGDRRQCLYRHRLKPCAAGLLSLACHQGRRYGSFLGVNRHAGVQAEIHGK